jgi:hypothetical protein
VRLCAGPGSTDGAPVTRVTVVSIRTARCQFAQRSEADRTRYPVTGTAELVSVTRADGWDEDTTTMRFNGYVVELMWLPTRRRERAHRQARCVEG